MRAVFLEGVGNGRIETEYRQGKCTFLWFDDRRFAISQRCAIDSGSSENRTDSGMGVLQIRRSVAIERQHAIPVEHVVTHAISGEIGVLHRADADLTGDRQSILDGQFGILLGDGGFGAHEGFVEQIDELQGLTTAALQHFTIGSENAAERNMHGLGRFGEPASHTSHVEHHRQVLCLWSTHDIQEEIGVQTFDAVDHTGEITGGVVETTRALLHDERKWITVAIGVPGREHHVGTVGLLEESERVESSDHLREQFVVGTLTHQVVIDEQHPQTLVHCVEVLGGECDQEFPEAKSFGVTTLQRHDPCP